MSRHVVVRLVETQRYKQEGHPFDSRWGHRNVSLLIPSDRNMFLRSTQSLPEMSTRDNSWGVKAAGV